MASLDSLPADQRAVLQLVLQRGRSYEDIARLLSIDRAAVRQRALSALDALGPQTGLPDDRRAMITDYLLGQLPDDQRAQTRARLAENPGERAWARVIASELSPVAGGELPEIPVQADGAPVAADAEVDPRVAKHEAPDTDEPWMEDEPWADDEGHDDDTAVPESDALPEEHEPVAPVAAEPLASTAVRGRTSRLGGLILIGGVVVVVIVVVLILLLSGGGSKHNTAASRSSTTSTAPASTSSTSSTAARVVAQINLTPPKTGGKSAGIAEVLKEGANNGIAIVAQNVAPNTTKPPNAYAVWLYNSPTDSHILGFVNPGVGTNGRLSTAGPLPANAAHFKQLIVTIETRANPKVPGTVVLQGALTGLS